MLLPWGISDLAKILLCSFQGGDERRCLDDDCLVAAVAEFEHHGVSILHAQWSGRSRGRHSMVDQRQTELLSNS